MRNYRSCIDFFAFLSYNGKCKSIIIKELNYE